ncbi:FAD-dependent oxidoreductase [Puniceicoccus vermicola]|uniref:FAD-dependent oxidoreductase n=1 Tax=Puniceicoccus vermicola TaxID=388746 RepID=A0A7X1AZ31_9BACT|nr:FAD-dependent oxidoreductase [Puniceicoccus vermicola]MBC2602607.1 FAD-dependent oxidoreductase [Puniceicoccus vermicola]
MKTEKLNVEFCVVGGGLAGLCAAVAAARHGAKTVLVHDRPVLGGNASSEIRVPVQGAFGSWDRSVRETGIIEEIMLETLYRNPSGNWQMWDLAMHGIAKQEPNLTLLLNCSCTEAFADGHRLTSLKAWQSTTQTWYEVRADVFADCSGDSILASFAGAEMREGREAASEFDEPVAPEKASSTKMGMSLVFVWRDMGNRQRFMPPTWIHTYHNNEEAPKHSEKINLTPVSGANGFFVELGGEEDTIHDSEEIKEELLKLGLGLVDHYKNHGDHDAENLALEWFGFLPGKRESLRYVGDYILRQSDVQKPNEFDDIVAYGGWPIDDHDSKGSLRKGKYSHDWFKVNCPYGIPFRSLYSRNVENLMMAGRNISATHVALCTTRVMATCAVMGQAVGTAAALASREKCTPREVGQEHLRELQTILQDDDCWLPGIPRGMPKLTVQAELTASVNDPQALRDGHDREDEDSDKLHAWKAEVGSWAEYRFDEAVELSRTRMIFNSNLKRKWANMPLWYPRDGWDIRPEPTLVRGFRLLVETENGEWEAVFSETENFQRLVRVPVPVTTKAIRLVIDETWGNEIAEVFAWEVA